MDPKVMKIVGAVCLVICCVLLYVAYERYQANASNVRAMNQMTQSMPVGAMSAGIEMTPATPAATKYALVFAVLSAAGGTACLVIGSKKPSVQAAPIRQPIQ